MLLRMILAVVVLLAYRQGAEAAQPSWCKSARSQTEQTICATSELWALDACEDQLYRKAKAGAAQDGRKAIDAAETAWIATRDLCGNDPACIAQRYRERVARLDPSGGAPCANIAAKPSPPLAAPQIAAAPAGPRCALAAASASGVRIASPTQKPVAYGEKIEVNWQLPPIEATAPRMFLIGAMPDGVRFEGEFRYNEDGLLEYGPGFAALTGA
jgi:hypothetical protein